MDGQKPALSQGTSAHPVKIESPGDENKSRMSGVFLTRRPRGCFKPSWDELIMRLNASIEQMGIVARGEVVLDGALILSVATNEVWASAFFSPQ